MTFTAEGIVTILAAVGILVGIVATQIINIMNARTMRRDVAAVAAETKTIVATTAKIDGHVNSEKTAGEGRENTLRAENVMLREMLSEQKQAALMLAQAAAGASTTVVHTTNGAAKTDATDATVQKVEDKS